MPLVVADTSPMVYLLAIGHLNILPALFEKVYLPEAVHSELRHPSAPEVVREWAAETPPWVEVLAVSVPADAVLQGLGPGERRPLHSHCRYTRNCF